MNIEYIQSILFDLSALAIYLPSGPRHSRSWSSPSSLPATNFPFPSPFFDTGPGIDSRIGIQRSQLPLERPGNPSTRHDEGRLVDHLRAKLFSPSTLAGPAMVGAIDGLWHTGYRNNPALAHAHIPMAYRVSTPAFWEMPFKTRVLPSSSG